ncbi:DUF3238 domain-containing protein [Brevibacillus borstelensis]|uniref:DUF3238 domain-containing protein n=1 Tax=Brevibacillus borstelensis TaxID=45462 RepID=UPI000469B2BC|nr:DUF3238 domain-containing protein [Brevibacillus borstelensis]NOU55905.1 DUF3238 domain-containing protein [Brevibacillus borstelensis]
MNLKNSKFLSLVLSATLFFGILSGVNASSKLSEGENLDITNITRYENAIELTWAGDYNEYEVFANGKSVYKGKDKKFKHKELEADTFVEYLVVGLNEADDISDKVKVETYTLAGQSIKSMDIKPLDSLRVTTVYKKDSLKFDWDDISGIEEYEVFKNGEKIGTITKSEYSEKEMAEGLYEFVGKIEVEDSKKEKIRAEAKQKLQRELTSEEEEALFFENYSIIKSFNPQIEEAVTLASEAYSINLKYMTFIPSQYVENPYYPSLDQTIKYFNGNWRGFNPSSYDYKTRTETQYIFSNKSLNFSKSVGSSKFYDANKVLQYTRTARDSGIYMSERSRSNTAASFVVYHNCEIPYYETTTPEIDYTYTASIKSENGGKIVVSGSHDKAPSHEFYYQINGGPYRTIFQHDIVDFKYLFGLWPNWNFNFSN